MSTRTRIPRAAHLAASSLVAALLGAGAAQGQLTALGSAQLDQCSGPDACEGEDRFGSALAAGDFDGNGFADLAVGVPGETTNNVAGAGLVEIFYGSAAGLSATAGVLFTQETRGVPGVSEVNDHFGAALAAGDLDGDGFADLAIGVPDEDIGSVVDAGMVVVLFGSSSGLSAARVLEYDQSNLPPRNFGCFGSVSESPETGDRFGFSVAFGIPPGNFSRRLIIGVPGEDGFFPGQTDAGQLDDITFFDFVHEPRGQSCARFQDALATCSGTDGPERGDQLGWAVVGVPHAAADPDEVVGVPFEETAAGVVDSGVAMENGLCLQQNGPLAGSEESGDRFGGALAAGDFDADGFQDVAIGVAGESLGAATDAGAVAIVFADAADHLATAGNQFFDQNDFQPDAAAETGDHFGAALSSGDFDGDGRADLAIGVPDEDVNGHADAGGINVLYSAGAGGLTATGGQTFDQDHPAPIPSIAEDGDFFGHALAAGDFDGNGTVDLAIGVPGESGIQAHVGVVDLLYGLDRATGAFGTVSFTTAALTVSEHSPFTFVIADRDGGAVLAAAVDHSRIGGTATPGVDFNYTPGTLTWTAGDLSRDIKTISLVDDTIDEPDETIVIRLSNPSAGLALGAHPTITITIVDDDPPGQLFVDGFESGDLSNWSRHDP